MGDVFKIVLALATVPDPVFGEGPGIYFEKEWVEVWHMFPLRINRKYLPLLSYFNQGNTLINGFFLYTLIFVKINFDIMYFINTFIIQRYNNNFEDNLNG